MEGTMPFIEESASMSMPSDCVPCLGMPLMPAGVIVPGEGVESVFLASIDDAFRLGSHVDECDVGE